MHVTVVGNLTRVLMKTVPEFEGVLDLETIARGSRDTVGDTSTDHDHPPP